jgi:anti-anti-sigma factor
MAATLGVLWVRQDGPHLTFRAEGRATMHHSLPLRQCVEQAACAGTIHVRVDLRDCTYMDSTFLGTLLFLKKMTDKRCLGDFALVGPSAVCMQLLKSMCLDRIYPIQAAEELPAEGWTALYTEKPEAPEFRRNVVEAHQELAGVPGPASVIFGPVANCLAKDLEEEERKRTE